MILNKSKLYIALLLIATVGFFCQKPDIDDSTIEPPTGQKVEKIVVDTIHSKLLSSKQELDNGIFRYNTLPGAANLRKGNFLLEPRNLGYLRVIENVVTEGGEVKLTTSQGTIEQLYKDSGDVHKVITFPDSVKPFFNIQKSKLPHENIEKFTIQNISGVKEAMVDIPAFSISGSGFSFNIREMSFSFDPTLTYDFNVEKKMVKLGFQNITTSWKLKVDASLEILNSEIKDTFRLSKVVPKLSKLIRMPFQVGVLYGHMELSDCYLEIKARGTTNLQSTYDYEEVNSTVAYVEYSDGTLKAVYNKNNLLYKKEGKLKALADGGFDISIIPVFKIYCYQIPVVELGASPGISLNWKYNVGKELWNSEYSFGGQIFAQMDNTHYKFITGDLQVAYQLPNSIIFEAPKNLKITAGETQKAIRDKELKEPIEIQVLDSDSTPQGPVKVYYSSNHGKWEKETAMTIPLTGKVKNKFRIGDTLEEHILKASIRNANDELIKEIEWKLKPEKVDTIALLIGHGLWTAYEGQLDGNPLFQMFERSEYDAYCRKNFIPERIRHDKVTLQFNENKTGVAIEEYFEKYSYLRDCIEVIERNGDFKSVINFTWEYFPAKKSIVLSFLSDGEKGELNSKFISFNENDMELLMEESFDGDLESTHRLKFK